MNDTKDKQALWLRYVEGETLSRREKRMLLDWLGADEAARRACLEDERIAGFLAAYGHSQLTHARFIEQTLRRLAAEEQGRQFRTQFERRLRAERSPTRSAPAFGWRLGLAAAAMLLILAGLWIAHRPGPATVAEARYLYRILTAEGAVRDGQGQTLSTGAFLSSGTHLTTGADGYIVLIGHNGSRIALAPNTDATIPVTPARHRLELRKGSVYCQVQPNRNESEPFSLRTAAGHRLTVQGTQFDVLADGARTELRVESGRVLLETARDSVVANAGQSIVANGDRIGAAQPVARRAIAPWKFDREPLVDGPVLFEDDFEGDLGQWLTAIMKNTDSDSWIRREPDSRERTLATIERGAGRTQGSSALSLMGPSDPDSALTIFLRLDPIELNVRGLVAEYDVRVNSGDSAIMHIVSVPRKPIRFLHPIQGRQQSPVPLKEWYKFRMEYRFRTNDSGEEYVEIKSMINGQLDQHIYIYPNTLHLGFTILRGHVHIGNYVLRELIPADLAAQDGLRPQPNDR